MNLHVKQGNSETKKRIMAPTLQCSFETFSSNFDLPLKVAAEKFGVRATAFKKRCRAIGIRHWPYRKVRSLKRSLGELGRCQEANQLTSKQETQIVTLKKQLSGLMNPKTYGIESKDAIIPLTIKEKSSHKEGKASSDRKHHQSHRPSLTASFSAKSGDHLFKLSPSHQLQHNSPTSTLDWNPLPVTIPSDFDLTLSSHGLIFSEEQKFFGLSFASESDQDCTTSVSEFGTPLSFDTGIGSPVAEDIPERYDEDFGDFLVDIDSESGQNFLDDLTLDVSPLYESFTR